MMGIYKVSQLTKFILLTHMESNTIGTCSQILGRCGFSLPCIFISSVIRKLVQLLLFLTRSLICLSLQLLVQEEPQCNQNSFLIQFSTTSFSSFVIICLRNTTIYGVEKCVRRNLFTYVRIFYVYISYLLCFIYYKLIKIKLL